MSEQTPGWPASEALTALVAQQSHLLMTLSDPVEGSERDYLAWFTGALRDSVIAMPQVVAAGHYVEDDVDVTGGAFPKPPFRHLALYSLSVDGAEQAVDLILAIGKLHADSGCAKPPATWLYFPLGERVGIPLPSAAGITVAYANGLPGQEDAFREWYATRHIRHALNIPALSSGQCFERTLLQQPGAIEAGYRITAIYEQSGTAQEIVDAFHALPPEVIAFPALDLSRFSEVAYRKLR